MELNDLGWNSHFQRQLEEYGSDQGYIPARVARQNKNSYELLSEFGGLIAEVSGTFSFFAESSTDYPTVGDWVLINLIEEEQKGIIHKLLARKSSFVRKAAGMETDAQVIAANIDTVFVVVGLDRNFNLRRIERYITLIKKSNAKIVILLNKSDLCDVVESKIAEVAEIAPEVPIIELSATCDKEFSQILGYLNHGETVTLVGSSGTGKSTIINRLLGEDLLLTQSTSDKVSQGKHTTTWREIVVLPTGGIIIDTPGMREVQLWADEDDLSVAFDDITALSKKCKFRDCQHGEEPGCAIRDAVRRGAIKEGHLANYDKMKREINFLSRRKAEREKLSKARGKRIAKFSRQKKKIIY